jgi:hypothetical protein
LLRQSRFTADFPAFGSLIFADFQEIILICENQRYASQRESAVNPV